MKILTWNCNGALRKKYVHLQYFDADVHIIQECENPSKAKDKDFLHWARHYHWVGDNPHKGLGIFAKEPHAIKKLKWRSNGLKYFIPCELNKDITILATWCHRATPSTYSYIGQLWKYLQKHKSKLNRSIIAGDFNSNVIWDRKKRKWNHSDVVRELRELSIESLYHKHFNEEQGKELQPTFYLYKNLSRPYHLDYIFASEHVSKNLQSIYVGQPESWLELSDHMPVFCEI